MTQAIVSAPRCYPAVIAFYFMLPERQAWLANAAILAVTLPQAWYVLHEPVAVRVAATLLGVSAFSAIFVRVITRQQQQLRKQAVTDPLTGVANRTLLRPTLEQAIEQSRRTGTPMTLLAIDLNRFKTINDTLGHDAGDRVLRGVGELLKRRMRRSDKVFRLGGEEFLVLLYAADASQGRLVAESLRSAVESLGLLPDHTVTASIGVARLGDAEDRGGWMKRTDDNLYKAKASGRNRVES